MPQRKRVPSRGRERQHKEMQGQYGGDPQRDRVQKNEFDKSNFDDQGARRYGGKAARK